MTPLRSPLVHLQYCKRESEKIMWIPHQRSALSWYKGPVYQPSLRSSRKGTKLKRLNKYSLMVSLSEVSWWCYTTLSKFLRKSVSIGSFLGMEVGAAGTAMGPDCETASWHRLSGEAERGLCQINGHRKEYWRRTWLILFRIQPQYLSNTNYMPDPMINLFTFSHF